jgi:hypothetical protein
MGGLEIQFGNHQSNDQFRQKSLTDAKTGW